MMSNLKFWNRSTRHLKWLSSITCLAIAVPAVATAIADIPPSARQTERDYRMVFTLKDGDPSELAQEHKSKCEALGTTRCRVERFVPSEDGYGRSGSIRFILAPGTAPAFMTTLSQSTRGAGFTIESRADRSPGRSELADLRLRKLLLEAQREKLNSLEGSASGEQSAAILNMRSQVENEMRNIGAQLGQFEDSQAIDALSVNYEVPGRQGQSRMSRQTDELWGMFLIGIFVVSGVALLTALYFGILWLAFLGLRKIVIKRGLLKDSRSQ